MKIRHGFTLVELLIAASIFGVVLVSLYSGLHTGLFGFRDIERNIEVYQAARGVLSRLDQDLKNAFYYGENESRFEGGPGQVSFFTLVDAYRAGKVNQDYAWVSYQFQDNKLMRLCRRNKDSLNKESTTKEEEFASNVKIEFSYAGIDNDQSLKWTDKWTASEQTALPVAVKAKLTFSAQPDKTFERVIYLTMSQ